MADFAPSFSLGLDFDLDSEPQLPDPPPKPTEQPSNPVNIPPPTVDEFDDDDFKSPGQDPKVSDAPRTLKRLRRGPTVQKVPPIARKREPVVTWCNVDDEIEDFSSEDSDELPSAGSQSVCRSSKLSLAGHGVLSSQSSKKRKHVTNGSSSGNVDRSSNNILFPKLIVSPLRKFQLIDSDSDSESPASNFCANMTANKTGSSSNARQFSPCENASLGEEMKTPEQVSVSKTDDLWSNFRTEKSLPIPTPAFDEVCDELFRSAKDTNNRNTSKVCSQSKMNIHNVHQVNLGDPLPPAHSYFFHSDIRIQNLVRTRLPYFFPLLTDDIRESDQPNVSAIDYMGQFSHGESSTSRKKNAAPNSTRSRRQSRKTNAEEVSQGNQGWVDPKSSTKIPKNASKRRVQADGQSTQAAGHWYTGSNGKRVYVTKTGKELTGQIAYRHYKKESKGGWSTTKGSEKKSKSSTKRSSTKKK